MFISWLTISFIYFPFEMGPFIIKTAEKKTREEVVLYSSPYVCRILPHETTFYLSRHVGKLNGEKKRWHSCIPFPKFIDEKKPGGPKKNGLPKSHRKLFRIKNKQTKRHTQQTNLSSSPVIEERKKNSRLLVPNLFFFSFVCCCFFL